MTVLCVPYLVLGMRVQETSVGTLVEEEKCSPTLHVSLYQETIYQYHEDKWTD